MPDPRPNLDSQAGPPVPGLSGQGPAAPSGPPDAEAMMDPANKALADALQILLRVLQLGLVVIFALYVLSGFQSVKQGQTGIRLLFGAVNAENLEPGFRFSFPHPVGDLVKVDQGAVIERLDSQFWQFLKDDNERRLPTEQLPVMASLNPERDGSVLTGDNNVAHTRWVVTYSRTDATAWARNTLPEAERELVLGAVQRGVVQAVAEVSIDELLRESTRDTGAIAQRAMGIAQQALDRMQLGVRLQRLDLSERIPPTALREKFAAVQAAEQDAGKARSEALGARDRILAESAGGAAEPLLAQIDVYEAALEKNDRKAADAAIESIRRVLDGEPVETASGAEVEAGGAAAREIDQARQYRSQILSQRQAELAVFRAKLQQFRTNPSLLVQSEWAGAYRAFTGRDFVQVIVNPPGAQGVDLVLNQDPQIVKDMQRRLSELEGEEARKRREEAQRIEQGRLQRGISPRG
jgi:membrane protease subunit HflK